MLPIDYVTLSPIGTDEFPCLGAKHLFKSYGNGEKPYCYALRVAIKETDGIKEMLVKIPLSKQQVQLAHELATELFKRYPVTVTFENLQIYRYQFPDKIVYTATATTFQIMED